MKIREIILFIILAAINFGCTNSDCDDLYLDGELLEDSSETREGVGVESFNLSFSYNDRFESMCEMAESDERVLVLISSQETGESHYVSVEVSVDDENITLTSCGDSEELSEIPHDSHILRYIGEDLDSDDELSDAERTSVGLLFDVVSETEMELLTTVTTRSSTLGAGSMYDPYVIVDEDDFITLITDKLDAGNSLSGVYFQQSGLLLCSKEWSCAGVNTSTYFQGNYNGGCKYYNKENEYGIHNLFITSENNVALFYGIGSSGVVEDLALSNANFVCSNSYAGGVATRMEGGTLKGVKFFSGNVLGSSYIGGLVGVGHGTIEDCYVCCNLSNISDGEGYGGYIGECNGTTSFDQCIYRGAINIVAGVYVGGYIGHSTGTLTMSECYVCGDIVGSSHIGGFVGMGECNITMSDCIGGATKNTLSATDATIAEAIISSVLYTSDTMDQSFSITSVYATEKMDTTLADYSSKYLINLSLGGFFGSLKGNVTNASHYTCKLTGCSLNYYEALDVNQATLIAKITEGIVSDDDGFYYGIGGLCGIAQYMNFSGCHFTNNATIGQSTVSASYTGGIFGYLKDSIIDSSSTLTNNGSVNSKGSYTGGIIGCIRSSEISSESISNLNSVVGSDYVGGVYGYSYSDCVFNSGVVFANYASVSGSKHVGGIGGLDNANGLNAKCTVGKSTSSIAIDGSNYCGGLFGWTSSDTTVSIANSNYVTVSGGGSYVGGHVGYLSVTGDAASYNVIVDQHIAIEGASYVGGLIGYVSGGKIGISTYSRLIGSIKATGQCVGGVVGKSSSCEIEFTHCYNDITVTTTGKDSTQIEYGGIIGRAEGESISVDNCYNRATITGGSASVGGLIGIIDCDDDNRCNIEVSFNDGDVICNAGSDSANVGGILGKARSSTTITSCYNSGDVTKVGSGVAGIVGYVLHVDKTKGRYQIVGCYNVGTAGYGTAGGSSSLHNYELEGTNVYYYSSVSNGDLTKNKYSSTPYTKDEMNKTLKFSESVWSDAGESSLPYLTDLTPSDIRSANRQ